MNDRRRGLGRGLGALIPTAGAPMPRPVDVFFEPTQTPQSPPGNTAGTMPSVAGPGVGDEPNPLRPNVFPLDEMEDDGQVTPELLTVPGASFAELPLESITPNPRQPRDVFDEDELAELASSIATIGVLQPIVVRPVADGYELVMGERRWRAAGAAGLTAIPAIIRDTADDDLLRDALLENLHRSQLNPLEEAAAYRQLLDDFGCTQDELATRIGRSRPQVSNTLRLLRLPPLVQRRVAAGVLSAGHARALLGLTDGGAIERLAQRIVAEGLSVRSVEEIVALGDADSPEAAPRRARAATARPELVDYQNLLSDYLDTRATIAMGARKGKVTIEFATVEDLGRILTAIGVDAGSAGNLDASADN